MSVIKNFHDLIVYQKAFSAACRVFDLSRTFPQEEKYALTDQIRRSSRSVAANIAEAWAKKIYPKSFVSKLSDSLGEEMETEVWLHFCFKHQYITSNEYQDMTKLYREIRMMLTSMINNSDKFSNREIK
jgi:four helix bundle protein